MNTGECYTCKYEHDPDENPNCQICINGDKSGWEPKDNPLTDRVRELEEQMDYPSEIYVLADLDLDGNLIQLTAEDPPIEGAVRYVRGERVRELEEENTDQHDRFEDRVNDLKKDRDEWLRRALEAEDKVRTLEAELENERGAYQSLAERHYAATEENERMRREVEPQCRCVNPDPAPFNPEKCGSCGKRLRGIAREALEGGES